MQLTQKITLKVIPNIDTPNIIKWRNQLGGWDSVQVTKYRQMENKNSPNTYKNAFGEFATSVDVTKKDTYYSVWLDNTEYNWFCDLFNSTQVYVNNAYTIVQAGTIEFDSYENLWNFKIVVTPKQLKYVID